MGDVALAGSSATVRVVQPGKGSSWPNEEERSRKGCRVAHWFRDMRNSDETHVDLCLLQEVAKIQGRVRLLVHPSCQA